MEADHASRRTLPVLLPVPFTWALSTSLLIPVLPRLRAELGVGAVQVSLLLTALSLPAGLLLPLAGFLADRRGRRPVLTAGLVVYGLGGLLAGLLAMGGAPFAALVAARALQGVGAAATNLIALSMAADLFTGARRLRAVGSLEAANSTGKLAAPLLGGAASQLSWYAPFFLYPLVAWPVAAAVWFRAGETLRRPLAVREYVRQLGRIWRWSRGALLAAYLGGFVALAVWFGVLVLLADRLDEAGRGGLARGALVSLPVAVLAAASAVAGRLGGRLAARGLALAGLGVVAATAAVAALGWLEGSWGAVLAVALVAAGLGLALPGLDAQVTDAVDGPERGLLTTILGATRALGGAAGPPLFTALAASGPALPWLVAALASAAVGVAVALAPRAPVSGSR